MKNSIVMALAFVAASRSYADPPANWSAMCDAEKSGVRIHECAEVMYVWGIVNGDIKYAKGDTVKGYSTTYNVEELKQARDLIESDPTGNTTAVKLLVGTIMLDESRSGQIMRFSVSACHFFGLVAKASDALPDTKTQAINALNGPICTKVTAAQQAENKQAAEDLEVQKRQKTYEQQQEQLKQQLATTFNKRKQVGDTVCNADGWVIGQVEQVAGERIEIRTHNQAGGAFTNYRNWDQLDWIDYRRVAICNN
jgi:hypothetical protein